MTKTVRDNPRESAPRFFVSPKTTVGVDTQILVQLGDTVESLIHERGLGAHATALGLRSILLFPVVADPSIFDAPEYVQYKRKVPSVFVSRKIPFDKWMKARRAGRIKLAINNFCASIEALDDSRVPIQIKKQLEDYVFEAGQIIGRKDDV